MSVLFPPSHRVLFDGPMGTALIGAGFDPGVPLEGAVLTAPETVRAVHVSYRDAGATILRPHTFLANHIAMAESPWAGREEILIRSAVDLARGVLPPGGLLAGSMGPIDPRRAEPAERRAAYGDQSRTLTAAGVNLLLLETFLSLEEMRLALAATAETGLPRVALFAFSRSGITLAGESPQTILQALHSEGVSAVGANCGEGPEALLPVIEQLCEPGQPPVVALPSAGLPGDGSYPATPESFEQFGRRAAELGVRAVGGCCGSNPDHLRALKRGFRPGCAHL